MPEQDGEVSRYEVGPGRSLATLGQALHQWAEERPTKAIIEITASGVYTEAVRVALQPGQNLEIRAANRTRPVIRLLDYAPDARDAMSIVAEEGSSPSSFTLDGLIIMGRGIVIQGPVANVAIRHCTLVPGWGSSQSEPGGSRPFEPSLLIRGVTGRIRISRSIIGPIGVDDEGEPAALAIEDSILDAGGRKGVALCGPEETFARVVLTLKRTTVFGRISVHAVELAENTLFQGGLHVARRQQGCMRFCYAPPGSRTPRRYHCQPDLVMAEVRREARAHGEPDSTAAEAMAAAGVRPVWTSTRYGTPAYAQLAEGCPEAIRRGADDESEMGCFHHLFAPQREANLAARLEEYTPAGSDAGIIHAT
jgi:hypothetical protein